MHIWYICSILVSSWYWSITRSKSWHACLKNSSEVKLYWDNTWKYNREQLIIPVNFNPEIRPGRNSSFQLVSEPSYNFIAKLNLANEGSWIWAVTAILFKIYIPRLFVMKMTKSVIVFCLSFNYPNLLTFYFIKSIFIKREVLGKEFFRTCNVLPFSCVEAR